MGVSDFLGALGDQLVDQFSLGENTTHTLNSVIDGKEVKYGALGEFANKFDQSAERRYLEQGYLRETPHKTVPKQLEILMQEPNATILVKKKMFSSIADNFRPDFMDSDEKLYFRAIKILFQNKCRQIATLEKLSKLQKVTSIVGQIDDSMIPLLITLMDELSDAGFENSEGSSASSVINIADKLKRIYGYNLTSPHTTWITDSLNLIKSQYAEGTGVIEFTNFSSLSTSTSVSLGGGNCNFSIEDPYNAMTITSYDIERAIADATNVFYTSKTFQAGKENITLLIDELQRRLNKHRAERGASPISFKINPDTLLGRRVIAIIDRIALEIKFDYNALAILGVDFSSSGVSVAPEYLKGGAIAGEEGLSKDKIKLYDREFDVTRTSPDSEYDLFQRLVKAIFDRLTLIANSNNALQIANEKTNYARRKLRFNFLGKLIIQPQDVVHIYVSSRSKYDKTVMGGMANTFNGMGLIQNVAKQLTDLKDAFNAVFSPQTDAVFQIEKAAFVGKDFPNSVWSALRSQFVDEKEGVHVFGGVVGKASLNWSNGVHKVSVTCKDNTAYFEMGQVNFKPGVDVFNGSIFDPLTPFKTKFGTISSNTKEETPELLEENKYLLSFSGEYVLAKHKEGPSVGQPLTAENIIQDKSIDPTSGLTTRVFYAPDGLVYKWKEGIGILVQYGDSTQLNPPDKVGIPSIYKDPFAGQDIMNVLSLLITGVPYNFTTYWKAIGGGAFNADPNTNRSAAETYFESIRTSLAKNNLLWGNFIPFKNLTVDEATFAKHLQGQFRISNLNSRLDEYLQKYTKLQEDLQMWNAFKFTGIKIEDKNPEREKIVADLTKVGESVRQLQVALRQEDKDYYVQSGDEVIYESSDEVDSFISDSEQNQISKKARFRQQLRRQVNFLSRRMSYNVRANDDKNLFIVDDYYDKDYDILAYNQQLDNIKLYNNTFTTVKEKIKITAEILNLEVFCDTQGHIRVRSPQYNRMPSSIFYNMINEKRKSGVQIYPDFVDELFTSKMQSLKEQIEVVEDYIRLQCATLGYNSDHECIQFIEFKASGAAGGLASNESFKFISNPYTGTINKIEDIVADASSLEQSSYIKTIQSQAQSRNDVFSSPDRAQFILGTLRSENLKQEGFPFQEITSKISLSRINELSDRIYDRTGMRVNLKTYTKTSEYVEGTSEDVPDLYKTTKDLSEKIAERQKAVRLFYITLKNCSEFKSIDTNQELSNMLLSPSSYANEYIPEVFTHMIEDETYDDLGPGSGSRYIIKNSQIQSFDFYEEKPSFTSVEVRGTLNPFAPDSLPKGLNTFPAGGNALTTAMAVDYDMWRSYGLITPSQVNAPFLQSPHVQCAPYASMLLSRARKEVLKGSVTISGNEFMQPGEVVYIEDRGLLYYVDSVRHSFNYASGFTTALTLTYGHAPGEYIPTTLDVMGKMIYNNRDLSSLVVQRQTSGLNEKPIAVLKMDANSVSYTESSGFYFTADKNEVSLQNEREIKNALYAIHQYINTNEVSVNNNPPINKVQVRYYYSDDKPENETVKGFANLVVKAFTSVYSMPNTGEQSKYPPNPIPSNLIDVVAVNLDDADDPRSPSQNAWNIVRDLVATRASTDGGTNLVDDSTTDGSGTKPNKEDTNNNTNSQGNIVRESDKLRSTLFRYIVDCWIVFDDENTQEVMGT